MAIKFLNTVAVDDDVLFVDTTNDLVGIGTTSPSSQLHVKGNVVGGNVTTRFEPQANNAQSTLYLSSTGSGDGGYYYNSNNNDAGLFSYGDYTFNVGTANISGTVGNPRMVIKQGGNVGIGTTNPETKLSVVGETSTNNLIGGSINLATSYGWSIPSGTFTQRVGYYGGDFTLNGLAAENSLELGLGPFNDRQLLWTTVGSIDNNGDGGWNKTLTNLDINSSYLSVVYFRRTSSETAGTFYHGTGNNILNLNGTANTNPYFTVRALSGFDQNVWYASVGVIQSNSDSNTVASPLAGIYRLDTGAKINGGNGYKFDTDGATLSRGHRAYLFYSADVDVVGQFTSPGFYKIDGDQPKLHDILGGDNDDIFWSVSGDNIYNDNSGNVGIGLTNPDTKLTIENASGGPASTTYATTASKANLHLSAVGVPFYNHLFMGIGSATYAWIQAQHGNSAAQNLVLNPIGGNVGIGTTSPNQKLEVSAATDTAISIASSDTSIAAGQNVGILEFSSNNESSLSQAYTPFSKIKTISESAVSGTASVNGAITFETASANTVSEKMRIKANGNVGIGTTNPGSKLEVNGEIDANGGGYSINGMGFAIENSGLLSLGDWDGNDFQTRIMDQNGMEVLRVNDEKVGIGTTTPSSKLDVNGAIVSQGGTYVATNGTATDAAYIVKQNNKIYSETGSGYLRNLIYHHGNGSIQIGQDGTGLITDIVMKPGTSGNVIFRTSSNSETVRISSSGNVGIGTTAPGSKLDIVGATNTSDSSLLRVKTTDNPNAPEKVVGFYVNTNTERGFISVNQYATAYSTSSDYRLKENIVPIPNSIERLKELKPCRFNFIQGDPNYVVDGFIAHEAAEVVPEAVTGEKDAVDEDNNPSYQGIDQSKVVPLLTAALQEAIEKIEQLELRIQTLENN